MVLITINHIHHIAKFYLRIVTIHTKYDNNKRNVFISFETSAIHFTLHLSRFIICVWKYIFFFAVSWSLFFSHLYSCYLHSERMIKMNNKKCICSCRGLLHLSQSTMPLCAMHMRLTFTYTDISQCIL